MKLYDQDPVSGEICMYVPVSSQKVFDQILRNEFAATKPLDFSQGVFRVLWTMSMRESIRWSWQGPKTNS